MGSGEVVAARREAAAAQEAARKALEEAKAARREAEAAKSEAHAALAEAREAASAARTRGDTSASGGGGGSLKVKVQEEEKPTTKEPKQAAQQPQRPAAKGSSTHLGHGETPLEGIPGADQECPGGRDRPYHLVITAQGTVYQSWQTRIMYYHYLKQKQFDVCGNMGGATRLVALDEDVSETGRAAMEDDEVPTFFVPAIPLRTLQKYKGYGVVNRPHSLKLLFASQEGMARITEDYIFIAETDHIFTIPIPNMATPKHPRAFKFGYMGPNPDFKRIIERHWPGGNYLDVQSMGPSPVIIHKDQFASFVSDFNETSVALKLDPEADKKLNWVLEMWGYAITAAKHGIIHTLDDHFCTEAAHNSGGLQKDFPAGSKIMHFTYGIEYFYDAKPCPPWNIGHWSLDKRHYGGFYPPKELDPPPESANVAAHWLHAAWQEAITNTPGWPDSPEMGTWGWRREQFSDKEGEVIPAAQVVKAKEALVGSKWTWKPPHESASVLSLEADHGSLNAFDGLKWGWLPSPDCMEDCWFVDTGAWDRGRFNLRMSRDWKSFKARETTPFALQAARDKGEDVPEIQGTRIN